MLVNSTATQVATSHARPVLLSSRMNDQLSVKNDKGEDTRKDIDGFSMERLPNHSQKHP